MHPSTFDKKVESLNPGLQVRRTHEVQELNEGIKYYGKYVCPIPQGYIFHETHREHTNFHAGVPHRSIEETAVILLKNHRIDMTQYFDLLRTR